jgi:S-adenosylmethionine:tRNA ribosyltransferase-isomerase
VWLQDFDYDLPAEAIAQEAVEPRDAARLLAHDLKDGATEHARVRDLPRLLRAGDLLVVNDTRVRAARLLARRPSGGRVEVLLLAPLGDDDGRWRVLARPASKLRPGEPLRVAAGAASAQAGLRVDPLERGERGVWTVRLVPEADEPVEAAIARLGRMPLPPYIHRGEDDPRTAGDRERYQTVYAREPGSAAAPTAGLHFTPELLERLEAGGVERAQVTLHVGEGTFRPVEVDDPSRHPMHAERLRVPPETAAAVARCRARGGRVVAVGTTSVRALESAADGAGGVRASEGDTRLFLLPGAEFRVVDALLTNFHLPRSTLLMLVAAFAGRERTLALYREALEQGYRFYSYGDAMLLTRPRR